MNDVSNKNEKGTIEFYLQLNISNGDRKNVEIFNFRDFFEKCVSCITFTPDENR